MPDGELCNSYSELKLNSVFIEKLPNNEYVQSYKSGHNVNTNVAAHMRERGHVRDTSQM